MTGDVKVSTGQPSMQGMTQKFEAELASGLVDAGRTIAKVRGLLHTLVNTAWQEQQELMEDSKSPSIVKIGETPPISLFWTHNMTQATIQTDAKTAIKMLAVNDLFNALVFTASHLVDTELRPEILQRIHDALKKAQG